jgi:hypothetical protein
MHVEVAVCELSLERFAAFEISLYQAIFSMMHSTDVVEQIGGVLAVRELIDCSSAAIEQKVGVWVYER